ncbi:MAG: hypothetical protein N2971_08140 [Chlorobi bacterium]|nr:hypothetical protein [Chlorobiota bacterium]
MALTQKQQQALEYIKAYLREHGYSPSYAEIRSHLGFASLNAVSDLLRSLERKGYVQRLPGRSRALTVVEQHPQPIPTDQHTGHSYDTLPIIGTGSATNPLAAFLRPQGLLHIDPTVFGVRQGECFAAIAPDSTMEDRGIYQGDILIVEQADQLPLDGAIVLCFTASGNLVRQCSHKKDGTIELRASQRGIPPLRLDSAAEPCRIVGIIRGLIRRYH